MSDWEDPWLWLALGIALGASLSAWPLWRVHRALSRRQRELELMDEALEERESLAREPDWVG